MERIFPRNLTALAGRQVTGNPVTTRLESGVGNCFPGLEFDHRNLDRRFFPGLIFEFRSDNPVGARLAGVDTSDPDLTPLSFTINPQDAPDAATQTELSNALRGEIGNRLQKGTWYLESITQKKKKIRTTGLDGLVVWRLIRSLELGPVTIRLEHRVEEGSVEKGKLKPVELRGWRRVFTGSTTGTLSAAYAAGELTQSLCSPWMHDFRDCACYYWASNHPDIVLAEDLPGEPILPDAESEDPVRANTPIDWLRSDRARARTAPALGSDDQNRP